MACVEIRGCRIGEGRPKTIIPIVERTLPEILARAAEFSALPADFVEWRADWYDDVMDEGKLTECLRALRTALGEKPLLVTFRTAAEGGEKPLTPAEHRNFCRIVCESGAADLIDLELLPCGRQLPELIKMAHAAGVKVICSSHDFEKTPTPAEMVNRMTAMQTAGADIAKLAVMPRSREDVISLLFATSEMAEFHPETPVVTMSMGALGAVSRVCGEALGSAMTFASAGKASAPGQIDLDTMKIILEKLKTEA